LVFTLSDKRTLEAECRFKRFILTFGTRGRYTFLPKSIDLIT